MWNQAWQVRDGVRGIRQERREEREGREKREEKVRMACEDFFLNGTGG